ncbi:MAG: hypothetical protein QOE35_2116 [Actinomycetota bacterium]|jgi:hypothetical protein
MSPKFQFLCFLGAAVSFALAALGGTRKGSATQPVVLVPIGLLLWLLPTLWNAWQAAF